MQKVWTSLRAVSTQGLRQVCLSSGPKSRNLKHFATRVNYPWIFLRNAPNASHKQPQPSRVPEHCRHPNYCRSGNMLPGTPKLSKYKFYFGRCNVSKHYKVALDILNCETSHPLQHSKMPRTPNLSKMCPDDCFSGLQSRDPNFSKICRNIEKLSRNRKFSFLTNF